jgi:HEAT repeat protein
MDNHPSLKLELERLFQELEVHLSQLTQRRNTVGRRHSVIAHSILDMIPQSQNPQVCALLIKRLQTASHEVTRSTAAEALGKLQDENAVDALLMVLNNASEAEEVRSEAALALGQIRAISAIPTLIETLRNKRNGRMVMWHCADALALGRFNDLTVVNALIDALVEDYSKIKDSSDIRDAAQDALVAIGGEYTVKSLLEKLALPRFNTVDYVDKDIRWRIIVVLGQLKNPLSVNPLLQVLNSASSTSLQEAAIESLANFDDPRVILAIQTALNSPDESVHNTAKRALERLGHQME